MDKPDRAPMGLLHAAIHQGDLHVVKFLLVHGFDVNTIDENGDAPLHAAVLAGYPLIVNYLIQKGADLTARNGQGETPKEVWSVCAKDGIWSNMMLIMLETGTPSGPVAESDQDSSTSPTSAEMRAKAPKVLPPLPPGPVLPELPPPPSKSQKPAPGKKAGKRRVRRPPNT